MLKKTITYTDYNGVERTEDFYFNLTETELYEMEYGVTGGYKSALERIIAAKDTPTLIKEFRKLIEASYGVRSEDGRRFIKSEELTTEFTQTEAFNILYMELATDDKAGAEFVNGIIPKKIAEAAAANSDKEIAAKVISPVA